MSELKATRIKMLYNGEVYEDFGTVPCTQLYYRKEEADKVIAYRDCEIKKLKDSLNKLLKAKTEQILQEVIQKALIYGEGFVPVEHAIKLVAEIRHNKYKRCLALYRVCKDNAGWWDYEQRNRLDEQRGNDESLRFKEAHAKFCNYVKWEQRWLELAEKFKE